MLALADVVPHLDSFSLSDLPETHLAGFASAFLSLSFQNLPQSKVDAVDWETPLPEVVFPPDGEVLSGGVRLDV